MQQRIHTQHPDREMPSQSTVAVGYMESQIMHASGRPTAHALPILLMCMHCMCLHQLSLAPRKAPHHRLLYSLLQAVLLVAPALLVVRPVGQLWQASWLPPALKVPAAHWVALMGGPAL
jgi:hypothetical protein